MAAYQFGVGEYETANGRKAEVLATKNGSLIGVVYHDSYLDGICVCRWRSDGEVTAGLGPSSNLLPPKQTRTAWVNIYGDRSSGYIFVGHNTKHSAVTIADDDVVACKEITIEFTPGEGLEK